jgi:hypothetical protein
VRPGTKTVLFGFHQPLVHSWFVAAAWWKLFGFPRDPRLWIAFFVHDLGYWGKPNLDGLEGEDHVIFGAKLMRVFGHDWYLLTLLHSRFWARRAGMSVSKLCLADKLAITLTPYWLWKLLVLASGEWREYASSAKYGEPFDRSTMRKKYMSMVTILRRYIEEQTKKP